MHKIKKARSELKAKITRFETFIKTIKECEQNILGNQIKSLQGRLDNIIPLLAEFEDIHQKIIDTLDENDNSEDIHLVEFENKYHDQIGLAKEIIEEFYQNRVGSHNINTQNLSISGRSDSSHGSNRSNNSLLHTNMGRHFISLPKIDLTKFNGDTQTWLEFKNIFISLIHDNNQLNETQKFHYLKSCLYGTAIDVISSLNFTAENYNIAWQTLLARFDQPRIIIKNHLNSILELEMQRKESSRDLRKITDALSKHISAARSLATPEELFETLIVYLVANKLDAATVREWEMNFSKGTSMLPTLKEFKEFLMNHANLLENIEKRHVKVNHDKPKMHSKSFVVNNPSCSLCKGEHSITRCEKFTNLSARDRVEKVKQLKICFNCLSRGHFQPQCSSRYSCRTCRSKHHTLLHLSSHGADTPTAPVVALPTATPSGDDAIQVISAFCSTATQVLLPTATAKIKDSTGNYKTVRILLDSGSQSNFIKSNVCTKLNLHATSANVSVSGLNNSTTHIKSRCNLELHANHSNFKIKLSCLVIDQITGSVPSFTMKNGNFKIPKNICLSDPDFDKSGEIDLLIGSPSFFELLCIGQFRLGTDLPILQKTHLGWIISGPTGTEPNNCQVQCHLSTSKDLQGQLARFWEIDNYPSERVLSREENECEAHYASNTRRDANGRFVVAIPFKESPSILGESYSIAKKRLISLEKRLLASPELKQSYTSFVQEYIDLGHMSLDNSNVDVSYYLPHHGVHKSDSLTTKLRVVFNGSSTTTTGHSLNSIQMIGPTIQSDLFTILIRFRQHPYAIAADIEKMYRQVLIEPTQRPLQRILWRFSPNDPINIYNLNTVTYGTASASYLSIRSLKQLGIECEDSLPDIAEIIKRDFYVDDLLSGADSIEDARKICLQLSNVLKSGCFKLRKWISNNPEVLVGIPDADVHPGILEFGDCESSRTLGLIWLFQTDHFMFSISDPSNKNITKRQMLSEIAQIFDPLGLLTPCTFLAKVFMQNLWLEKLDWDDNVPVTIEKKWLSYRSDLLSLNDLRIPRLVTCAYPIDVQLHGFCDASINGYGACIYLRSTNADKQIYVNLLCAKSKVSPLRPTTIPKLELCGALLLSKLLVQVQRAITLQISSCFLWSDSMIVLGWLKTRPNNLKTFVCNRVADIQNFTSDAIWRHVPTKFNPADLLSRGATPQVLKNSILWWNGPPWLLQHESSWPAPKACPSELPEYKKEAQALVTTVQDSVIFENYSSLTKLERIVAYCLRFRKNCSVLKQERDYGPLTAKELVSSLKILVKISQCYSFRSEQKLLERQLPIKTSSPLISFNPFIDRDGLIRVGGRLCNSNYPRDKKHPLLIDGKHQLSKLIVSREHLRMLHAGPQLLLSTLRDRFWITNGRNLVKQTVHQCVTCFRFSSKVTRPIMGNLPAERVQSSFPFTHTGVDYAGPIFIKDRKGRGSKTTKSYLCLYVCFATKAVHLELVTSLSTEAFILSFRRFVARRGKPSHVYSDNGKNFVGANHQLLELGKFLKENEFSIPELIANEGISWHFIPAHSPHFGGLWEAGIKSCKSHLKRVLGNHLFTYEEFCTLLYQVEAVLNSRPIAPLSSDPNDFQPLTPGHFLVGRPLTSLPDPDVTLLAENRVDHFQRIQNVLQHLWKRWSKEYISELQQRVKWKTHHSDLTSGSLVLIKEDNQPPLKWKLGRVIKLHPGSDGINRVATLQTASGSIKRAFPKLCPLPCL